MRGWLTWGVLVVGVGRAAVEVGIGRVGGGWRGVGIPPARGRIRFAAVSGRWGIGGSV